MTKLSLSHNVGLKVLSLIVGVAVFIYVNSLELAKERNTRQVTLTVTGLPPTLEVVDMPTSVNVTLKAPFDVMERLSLNNLKLRAYVDLQNAEPGENDYRVGLIRPTDIKDLDFDWERSVTINIEQIEEQPYPVAVEWPDGFDPGDATVNAETVTLRGRSSELKQVAKVRVQLKPSQALDGGTVTVPVEVLGENGRLLTTVEPRPKSVGVTITKGDALPKRELLVSPKFVGLPKFGYVVQSVKVLPDSVVVQGDRKEIVDLSMIETEPIRIDGVRQSGDYKVKLVAPNGVRIIGASEVTVRVKVVRQ